MVSRTRTEKINYIDMIDFSYKAAYGVFHPVISQYGFVKNLNDKELDELYEKIYAEGHKIKGWNGRYHN